MVHLHKGRAAVFVDHVGDLRHSRDVLVVVEPVTVAPATARRIVDGGGLDDYQSRASPRHRLVEGQDLVSHDHVVFMPHHHPGSGLDDAVAGGDGPDTARFEQLHVLMVTVGQRTPPLRLLGPLSLVPPRLVHCIGLGLHFGGRGFPEEADRIYFERAAIIERELV